MKNWPPWSWRLSAVSLLSATLACDPPSPAPSTDAPGAEVRDGAADARDGGDQAELGADLLPNDVAVDTMASEADVSIDGDGGGASEVAGVDDAVKEAPPSSSDLVPEAPADLIASDVVPAPADSAADQHATADGSLPDAMNTDAADLASDAGDGAGCGRDEFRSDDKCISRVIAVATAQRRTCAVLQDGSAWCWGGTNFLTRPERVPGVEDARSISIGGNWGTYGYGAACVATAGGRALCWGQDYVGALGDGMAGFPPDHRGTAKPVVTADGQPLTGVRSVAVGMTFGCANTASAIMCWGESSYGQLGVPLHGSGQQQYGGVSPPQYFRPYAAAVPGAPAAVIGAGYQFAIGADETGSACGWGWNSGGHRNWPVQQEPLYTPSCNAVKPVAQIVGGYSGACFLHKNEELACWGYYYGTTRDLPGSRPALGPVRQVAAGAEHVCALETSGRVFCWGRASDGQLGSRPGVMVIDTPQEVKALGSDVVAIGGGVTALHNCAIMRDGSLRCWGRNQEGQLGNLAAGDEPPGPVPVKW